MTPKRTPHRVLILLAAAINLFLLTTVSIFSVFLTPMTALFSYSTTEVALAYSLYQLSLAVVGIFAGRMVDKYGARRIVLVGILMYAAGYLLTSQTTELWQLYLSYGLLAGGGAGAIYNPSVTTALRWFPDMRGKISGVLFAFASLSPFLFSPIANALIEQSGVLWTFQFFGLLFLVGMLAVVWFLHPVPPNYVPKGYVPKATVGTHYSMKDYSWREMLRTKEYYYLVAIFVATATAGNLFIGANATIAEIQIGMTSTLAALAVSATSLANLLGRLSFGFIYDRFHDFKTVMFIFFLTLVALLCLYLSTTTWLYFVGVAILGFAFGGCVVVFSPITSRFFGVKNMGVNYGFMFLGYAGSAFVGPQIAAYFRDQVGTFDGAYGVSALIVMLGVVLLILLYRKRPQLPKLLS